jgi:DNA (cytosine-5)-methyltransferase 1
LDFVSCFSVEKDAIPAKLSQAMFKHHQFMHDVFDNAFLRNTPHVDVFTAGFPCQSFSAAGLQIGLFDDRGIVVVRIIMWIYQKKPKVFILENVEGLVTRFSGVLSLIIELLDGINLWDGRKAYSTVWKVLNSRREAGIPQNRPRVFIVGIRVDVMVSPFAWPEAVRCRPLSEFLDGQEKLEGQKQLPGRMPTAPAAARKLVQMLEKITQQTGLHPLHNHFVASIGAVRAHFMLGASPCITRGRGGSGGHWVTSKQRFMSIDEIMRLQGVQDPGRIPRHICTNRQLGMVAGNAITVDMFARVLHNALSAAGLLRQTRDVA